MNRIPHIHPSPAPRRPLLQRQLIPSSDPLRAVFGSHRCFFFENACDKDEDEGNGETLDEDEGDEEDAFPVLEDQSFSVRPTFFPRTLSYLLFLLWLLLWVDREKQNGAIRSARGASEAPCLLDTLNGAALMPSP